MTGSRSGFRAPRAYRKPDRTAFALDRHHLRPAHRSVATAVDQILDDLG